MRPRSNYTARKLNFSSPSLSMNLILDGPDVVWLRSCEVVGNGVRSRISFADNRRMEDVVVHRLVQAIAINLRKLPEGAHVLSLPECLIEVPGLLLAGAHVMVTDVTETVRSVIFRFKEFVGAINRAFQVDVGIEADIPTQTEKLALEVLEDICMPLLNLWHSLDSMIEPQGRTTGQHLLERAEEFRFRTELLKRFIGHSDHGRRDSLAKCDSGEVLGRD